MSVAPVVNPSAIVAEVERQARTAAVANRQAYRDFVSRLAGGTSLPGDDGLVRGFMSSLGLGAGEIEADLAAVRELHELGGQERVRLAACEAVPTIADLKERQASLEAELKNVRTELGRVTGAISAKGTARYLVESLRDRMAALRISRPRLFSPGWIERGNAEAAPPTLQRGRLTMFRGVGADQIR